MAGWAAHFTDFAVSFGQFTDKYGKIFDTSRKEVNAWLHKHPNTHKVAMVFAHFVRMAPMVGLMVALPYGAVANTVICVAGSAFYSLAIEGNCIFTFSLPSAVGSMTVVLAYETIKQIALNSLKNYALAAASCVPLLGYVGYVILISVAQVEKRHGNPPPAPDQPAKPKCCGGV
jgi:hypothetical protein